MPRGHSSSSRIVRDPETGQFRRASDVSHHKHVDEREAFSGVLQTNIPAADLTTGNDQVTVDGDEAEIIDFTDLIESDEVFVAHRVELNVAVRPQRTATAEHAIRMDYQLRSGDSGLDPDRAGSGTQEIGIADVTQDQSDDDDVIFNGGLQGSGDFADSSAGVGAGGDQRHVQHVIDYPPLDLPGPGFDGDDELYVPHALDILGSDDQGAEVFFAATMHGQTYEWE